MSKKRKNENENENENKYEENPIITHAVDALMKAFANHPRSTLVTHQTISAVTGLEYYGQHWTAVIEKWRNRMRIEKQIVLIAERGVGYVFATVDRQLNEVPERRQRSARRHVRKAIKECMIDDNDSNMTNHLRLVKFIRLQSLHQMEAETRKAMKEQQHACYKKSTNATAVRKIQPPPTMHNQPQPQHPQGQPPQQQAM